MTLTAIYTTVAATLAYSTYISWSPKREQQHTLNTIRSIRWWMPLTAIPVIAAVLTVAYLTRNIPGLNFTWWHLLGETTGNNINAGPGVDNNPGVSFSDILGVIMPLLLLLNLPAWAHYEEEMFRKNSEERSWVGKLTSAILFGLIHAIPGVPLNFCVALIIAGLYFTYIYDTTWKKQPGAARSREVFQPKLNTEGQPETPEQRTARSKQYFAARNTATTRAAAAHLTYNLIIVVTALTALTYHLITTN